MRTLLLLLALMQAAEQHTGDFIIRVPGGWVRRDRNDSTMLLAPSNQGRLVTYIVLSATPVGANADPRVTFEHVWAHVTQGARVTQGGQINSKRFDGGFDGVYATASLVDTTGQRFHVTTVGTVYGTRFETMTYFTNDFRNDARVNGQRALTDFIKTLKFGTNKAVTLPRSDGKLDGIYRAAGRNDLGTKYLTFFPDARVFEGILDRGMDDLDEDAEIKFHITGWGTYTMDGDAGDMTLVPANVADQTAITWAIHAYPNRLEIHGDRYSKMESGDGVKLNGTFRRADYKTLFASAQHGITFTPDGRFKDEGIFQAAFVQNRTARGYDFDDGAPGTGTYRVRHYSLELTYDGGRSKRAVFYLDPSNTKDDVTTFWFNEYLFARVP